MQLMNGWRQRPLAAASSGPTQSRPRRARGILLTAVGPVRLSVAITLALAYSGYALAQQVHELPTQNLPANMFAVPGLGRGFVGQWAGWIRPDPAGFHGSKLPAPWADGIFFGESKGVVYMRRVFFGPRQWTLGAKEVAALAPDRAQFKANWSCASCTPALVNKVVVTFTLVGSSVLREVHVNHFYRPGEVKPFRIRRWTGLLHPYDAVKDRTWKEAIARQGQGLVYRGKLKESRPADEQAW